MTPLRYLFGHYQLDTERFELLRGQQQAPLQKKVFDLLRYLVERRGQGVTKDELWPNEFVRVRPGFQPEQSAQGTSSRPAKRLQGRFCLSLPHRGEMRPSLGSTCGPRPAYC